MSADPNSEWSHEDPRNVLVGRKQAQIVILRRAPTGRMVAGTADVEMKHGWFITTSFEDHRSIDVWDKDWMWTLYPRTP